MKANIRLSVAAALLALCLLGEAKLSAAGTYSHPTEQTALDLAMRNLQPEVAKLLVAGNQDISVWAAAFTGDLDRVRSLIGSVKSVDDKDKFRITLLHYAACGGHKDVVEFVLSQGADINRKTGKPPGSARYYGGYSERERLSRRHFAEETTVACTPLHFASRWGHTEVARLLIAKGAKIDESNSQNWTALHYAALGGHRDMVELLIDKGADIEKRAPYMPRDPQYKKGFSPLHCAVFKGHREVAELLIDRGALVDARENKGITPLHYAAQEGHKEIAEMLIAKGASVGAKTGALFWYEMPETGYTPLHFAAFNGCCDIVRLLIDKGANARQATKDGQTALSLAAKGGHEDVVELLLKHGLDIDSATRSSRTPLHEAARKGSAEITKLLVAQGANVNAKDYFGNAPLLETIAFGHHKDVARILIDNGADVNDPNNGGWTPLHEAATSGYPHDVIRHVDKDIAEMLIAKGAKVNVPAKDGRTPLHNAVWYRAPDIVKLLLDYGADVNAKDKSGRTPLDCLRSRGTAIAELLKSSGSDIDSTPEFALETTSNVTQADGTESTDEIARRARNYATIHQAVKSGDIRIIRAFIANGADVNERDYWPGETALHWAAREGHKDIAEVLIAAGANVNAKSRHETMGGKIIRGDRTPRHHAAERGHKDIAELLIAKGADVNAKDLQRPGNRPLHNAIHRQHSDMAEMLVSKGADVNVPNDEGDTPLHLAAFGGCADIGAMLIDAGAQVNPSNQSGWTPLHNAAFNGHANVVELLLAKGANRYTRNKQGKIALDYALAAGFADIVKLLGGNLDMRGFGDRAPHSVVISEPQAVKKFLRFYGLEFDDVWIPEEKDVEGLDSVFKSYLDKNQAIEATGYFDREYVLSRLRRYNREYSGFIKGGAKYVICSMNCFGGGQNMYVAEVSSKQPGGNKFTIIMDGGSAVIRVIYDLSSRTVVRVGGNGM